MCCLITILAGSAFDAMTKTNVVVSKTKIIADVLKIDTEMRQSLGTGVVGLALLMRSGPRVFLRKDSMSEAESHAIKELQIKDYVTTKPVETNDGSYIEIVPTEKGLVILDALGHRGPTLSQKNQ